MSFLSASLVWLRSCDSDPEFLPFRSDRHFECLTCLSLIRKKNPQKNSLLASLGNWAWTNNRVSNMAETWPLINSSVDTVEAVESLLLIPLGQATLNNDANSSHQPAWGCASSCRLWRTRTVSEEACWRCWSIRHPHEWCSWVWGPAEVSWEIELGKPKAQILWSEWAMAALSWLLIEPYTLAGYLVVFA